MNIEHLIHMANQIGAYFESEPDRAVASAGVADHLARFWEKRMRQSLYA
jgi:formate dehydrogenase subunit delta